MSVHEIAKGLRVRKGATERSNSIPIPVLEVGGCSPLAFTLCPGGPINVGCIEGDLEDMDWAPETRLSETGVTRQHFSTSPDSSIGFQI
ncbi:conserved hypothetical protein [Coccidioides posadasii str. Silveira]|uniref:Uncharacterized protein n=1 Tax=Coccidioides posadasii (strain RMSCC 757 / Silveira) TaxID=443226 RepID=E9DIH5_COCPS|nr:conserved hypothetical protein [Coccidioides posadasii str. Silveira]